MAKLKVELEKELVTEVVAEPVVEPVKKEATKKDTTKKETTKKTAAKKAAPKKETVKEPKMKTALYIQFNGLEIEQQDILAKVKETWVSQLGRKVKDIKTMDTYVKPEEQAVYYVINETETGRIDL